MNEIKEAIAILKTRWLEAALIIGLWFLPNISNRIFRIYPSLRILGSLVGIGIFLLVAIISIGFLRTVYLEQDKKRSLSELMRIGKHFFWRFFGFAMLLGSVMMLYTGLLRVIIPYRASSTAFPLAHRIGFTLITIALAKLSLLIPAIIIVLYCSLFKSFGIMWKVKLLKAKPLLVVYLIQIIVLPYLLLFLQNLHGVQTTIPMGYALSTLYSIMLRILALMVQVMAVRFISPLAIDHNEHYNPPESFKLTGIA